jgi:hypothetical protein
VLLALLALLALLVQLGLQVLLPQSRDQQEPRVLKAYKVLQDQQVLQVLKVYKVLPDQLALLVLKVSKALQEQLALLALLALKACKVLRATLVLQDLQALPPQYLDLLVPRALLAQLGLKDQRVAVMWLVLPAQRIMPSLALMVPREK